MDLTRVQRIAVQHTLTDEEIARLSDDLLAEIIAVAEQHPLFFEFLEDNYLYRVSHVKGDSHETAFREGQRSVVADLYEALSQALRRRADLAAREQGRAGESTHAVMNEDEDHARPE